MGTHLFTGVKASSLNGYRSTQASSPQRLGALMGRLFLLETISKCLRTRLYSPHVIRKVHRKKAACAISVGTALMAGQLDHGESYRQSIAVAFVIA
jgi:hypothetical protein